MTPAHQFSQIPTAYYYSLVLDDREKALSFVEYALDEFNTRYTVYDHMKSVREYMRRWQLKHPSAAQRWIEEFRLEINKFHTSCIVQNNKNAEKTKPKKVKKSGTNLEQNWNASGTTNTSKSSMEAGFKNDNWNTFDTEMEQPWNGLTIYKKIEKEKIIGVEIAEYLKFRLSGENIKNPTGLEITILRDLTELESIEYKTFLEWKCIKLESSYLFQRLIDDFVNFGYENRNTCKDISQMLEKQLGIQIQSILFEIAFFEAKKVIFERRKIA